MATLRTLSTPAATVTWPRVTRLEGRHWTFLTASLVLTDAAALTAALALAYILRFKAGVPLLETPPHQIAFYSFVSLWFVPVWLGIFTLCRLYDRYHLFAGFGEYVRVVNAVNYGILTAMAFSFLDTRLFISRGWILLVWILSIVTVSAGRFGARRVLRQVRQNGWLADRTIIVGANEEGKALAEQFLRDAGSGLQIVGFVDNVLPATHDVTGGVTVLGPVADLEAIARSYGATRLVVAMTAVSREELLTLYQTFGHADDVDVQLSSGLFEILTTGVTVQEVSYVPLVTPQRARITGVDAFLKAALDYLGAIAGLVLFGPLFVAIAILVRLDSPGPIFHRRRVLGRNARPFGAFKFRTMVVNADEVLRQNAELRAAFEHGYKLKEDPRITRVGRFLRKTSLDELPQLINVLRGEMSLVGPRMVAPDEATRYGKWQLNLLTVKPGITGPWQVQGRSDIAYEDRVRLSTNYIRNYTIWADLEILLRTIPAVLKSRGAY